MEDTSRSVISLSSFHRLYRLVGTAAACVLMNLILLLILPDTVTRTISENIQWISTIETEYFLLWGVLVAPAWETIFQFLPSLMLGKHPGRVRVILYHLLAAIPFAAVHAFGYSVLYSIILLPTAFILAHTYYHFWQRRQMPYLMTAIVHGLINIFSYLIMTWVNVSVACSCDIKW